jgi:outer membrane murein-binding lipoprotein Lpp
MKKKFFIILTLVLSLGMVLVTGCTRHPNEEQQNVLEETIRAAKAAQAELDETVKERKQLESEVNQWKSKLEAAKKEKAAVEQRLQNWSE